MGHIKDEIAEEVKQLIVTLTRQYDHLKIKKLHWDRGSEFRTSELLSYLKNSGIEESCTPPNTPALNGKAERTNGLIMNMARTLFFAAKLPRSTWGWAVITSCRLLNALPSIRNNYKSPYELLNNKKPNYKYLRAFGCIAYATNHDAGKLDARVIKCKLLGYDTIGYILGVVDTNNRLTGQCFTSRDVVFVERMIIRNMDPEFADRVEITDIEDSIFEIANDDAIDNEQHPPVSLEQSIEVKHDALNDD